MSGIRIFLMVVLFMVYLFLVSAIILVNRWTLKSLMKPLTALAKITM